MNKAPHKVGILFVSVLVLFVLLGGAFYYFFPMFFVERANYDNTSPTSVKVHWIKEIRDNGRSKAYVAFKKYAEALPYERQHLSSHIIGEAFFEVLGVEGVAACDSSFGFGCFHGFFGKAVASGGESQIKKLDDVCVKTFGPLGTGCQHGLGHGILEYVGYQNVNQALLVCKNTTQLVPLLGCTSGVFMEYNTPLSGVGEGLAPETRKFNAENPYTPCPGVPEENRASCYYELGQWLLIALNFDYEHAGSVCGGLSGSDRMHCYLGMGALAVVLKKYSVEDSRAVCAVFAPKDELSCRAGVSWSLYADPAYRTNAGEACEYTESKRTGECLKLADLAHERIP